MILITDKCEGCFSCIFECPVNAILDRHDNPEGKDIFFIQKDVCIECLGYNDNPICIDSCSFDAIIKKES